MVVARLTERDIEEALSVRSILEVMCGDSHSENSAASTMMPAQSAEGLPDIGGRDGQDIKGLLPPAAAVTSRLTS